MNTTHASPSSDRDGGAAADDVAATSAAAGRTIALPAMMIDGQRVHVSSLPSRTHASPVSGVGLCWRAPLCAAVQAATAVHAARQAALPWQSKTLVERAGLLAPLAEVLEANADTYAQQLVEEIGKPVTLARGEVRFAAALIRASIHWAGRINAEFNGPGWVARRRAHGVVALITPWNNPLAIPVGKMLPALLYGNTVVWKPSETASGAALLLLKHLQDAGLDRSLVQAVFGDHGTAAALMRDAGVDAAALTGSPGAGAAAQAICSARHMPLQLELGGNNAAIVWSDADLAEAAGQTAAGAFSFAGQRCTGMRRAIVHAACYDAFLSHLLDATAALCWGDPRDEATFIGPVVHAAAKRRIADAVARAGADGAALHVTHASMQAPLGSMPCYYPPTIVCCDDAQHAIVQEETFGPVLVVQRARDWNEAMALCNGVEQGLIAALFSPSKDVQQAFTATAQAGVLKINNARAGVDAGAPLGGWKTSGSGHFEHGPADVQFYTRMQTVYDAGTAARAHAAEHKAPPAAGASHSDPTTP